MNADDLRRWIGPLERRVKLMLGRGILRLIDDAGSRQIVQIQLMPSELFDRIERFQEYGLSSVPHPGAEAVFASIGGLRGAGIVIGVEDRRYRLTGLAAGEVALHDDLGQKVHLTRDGILIETGKTATVKAPNGMRFETPSLAVTGDIKDHCDGAGITMQAMRDDYNAHTHDDPQGGTVGTATPQMTP